MAPEVASSTGYDSKADIFSFGMLLYNLLIDSEPWLDIKGISYHQCLHYFPILQHNFQFSNKIGEQVAIKIMNKYRPPIPSDFLEIFTNENDRQISAFEDCMKCTCKKYSKLN